MISRATKIVGTVAAAIVAGGLLAVSAPPTSLVNAGAYPLDASEQAEFETSVIPELTPFYDVDGVPQGPPGTLLKAEPVEEAPAGVRVWRIMYQSTDLQGNPLPVTGLYAVPDTDPPPGGFPLVSYAHGTTGVGRMCGISQTPFEPNTPGFTAWVPHIGPMVEQGWAVVASDYSGMGAPGPSSYLVGPLEGRGVLDALRAVIPAQPSIGNVEVNADQLGIYGKSQGGEAALSAMQLAPDYTPELQIDGGVSLAPGLTPALQGVLDVVASNPTSTSQNMFVLLIAKSFAENYPELVTLDEILSPLGQERIGLLDTLCGSVLSDAVSDVPLSQLINAPVASGLVTALADAMPGGKPLEMPAIVVQGLEDVTILPQFTHASVMSMCAWGDTVYYVRYPDDDHSSLNYQARQTQPSVIDWMEDRWAGEPAPDNCGNQLLGTLDTATGVND